MTVTFISNYLTHHQKPFCDAMFEKLGKDFSFIATNVMEEERTKMGWGLVVSELPYFMEYDADSKKAEEKVLSSDYVICGGTHQFYIENRLKQGKTTFRYFERLFRTGLTRAYNPRTMLRYRKQHTAYKNAPVYLLCAGGYVPYDFSVFGAYPDKMLKWGYFPAYDQTPMEELFARKEKASILWSGRMLSWKHPEEAIYTAMLLKGEGVDFHLTMIGEGEMLPLLKELVENNDLKDRVTFLPFMKPEEVREYMKQSEIYLVTSDKNEGWGAVLNEAMNSGCAVVASHSTGATPYLIPDDGLMGYIYTAGEVGELASAVYELLEQPEKRKNMAERAHESIAALWNPEEATERFLDFCDGLSKGEQRFYSGGPMSKAKVIKLQKKFEGSFD